jgi:hypothetical protein
MTTDTMTDAELTEAVTRWCEPKPSEPPGWEKGKPLEYQQSEKGFWVGVMVRAGGGYLAEWYSAYDFATDLNAWPKVYALLEEREAEDDYLGALETVLLRSGDSGAWEFTTATARQRCEALVAMRASDERRNHD